MDIKKPLMDYMVNALENINQESLKSFKRDLSSINVQRKIPSSELADKTAKEVVDCIIKYYTINDGPNITVKVLKEINECQVSQELQENIEKVLKQKQINEEKTPGKSLVDNKLRDATNRTSSRSHRRQHQRGEHGKENLLGSENLPQTPDISNPKTTQPCKAKRSLKMGGRYSGRRSHQDIPLVDLRSNDIDIMVANHEGKPQRYACLLFKHFVSFDTYKNWTKNKNFDGYGGKFALPENLRNAILQEVKQKFTLDQEDRRQIKIALNELLRNPRTSGWSILI